MSQPKHGIRFILVTLYIWYFGSNSNLVPPHKTDTLLMSNLLRVHACYMIEHNFNVYNTRWRVSVGGNITYEGKISYHKIGRTALSKLLPNLTSLNWFAEKLIVIHPVFVEREILPPCSENPAIRLHSESIQSSLKPSHPISVTSVLTLASHLDLRLPKDLFSSGISFQLQSVRIYCFPKPVKSFTM
jgi:hypothetical protein